MLLASFATPPGLHLILTEVTHFFAEPTFQSPIFQNWMSIIYMKEIDGSKYSLYMGKNELGTLEFLLTCDARP